MSEITTIVFRRKLRDAAVVGSDPSELSRVAVATYPQSKEARDQKKPPIVAGQTLDVLGGRREAVTVASTQDVANRVEARLREIFIEEWPDLPYPRILIDIQNGATLTNFDLPHRSADQILQMTDYHREQKRVPPSLPAFQSPYSDLTHTIEYAPLDVILGVWFARKGQPAHRLPRLLSSTLIGFGPIVPYDAPTNGGKTDLRQGDQFFANRSVRGSQRKDPLITGAAAVKIGPHGGITEVYTDKTIAELKKDAKGKKGDDSQSSSEVTVLSNGGIGDIPGGCAPSNIFFFEHVEQRGAFAIGQIAKMRFPLKGLDAEAQRLRNEAGRELLVALGLMCVRAAMDIDGMLRSECMLAPVAGGDSITAVLLDGTEEKYDLPSMGALIERYRVAVENAQAHGFSFVDVECHATDVLVKLIRERGKDKNSSEESDE